MNGIMTFLHIKYWNYRFPYLAPTKKQMKTTIDEKRIENKLLMSQRKSTGAGTLLGAQLGLARRPMGVAACFYFDARARIKAPSFERRELIVS
jgi:hypothetical protein